MKHKRPTFSISLLMAMAMLLGALAPVHAAKKKPNIVVIMADDVGVWNVSA